MAKKIDLTKSVSELTQEHPELVDILIQLGFSEITKRPMLHTIEKKMTIPQGAKAKNISMIDVVTALTANNFEIEGDMPTLPYDASESRKKQLKEYLKRLSEGEDLSRVQTDFVKHFSHVEASEIMEAEQELIKEGTPISEVQRLCDIHSALFHGIITEENTISTEQIIEESLLKKKIQQELAKRDSFPKKDYTDKNIRAAALAKIPGHPLYTFSKENEAFITLLEQFKISHSDELFSSLRELSTHYAKKGDLLYPHMKVKYGICGPSDVMWTVDDEIRDELSDLGKKSEHDEDWNARLEAVLKRSEEMIYKEQNILFPICAVNFSEEEWYSIYHDSKDYDVCFGVKNEKWEAAEEAFSKIPTAFEGEIVMPGGHMTIEQLSALLNTIPLEITFIDANNINRYFNEGPKVFKRPSMAIDREVFSCHPPKIEPFVRSIINDFRNGARDTVAVWMEKGAVPFLVTYMAVRDQSQNYLGTMEIVQDMTFAKDHFNK